MPSEHFCSLDSDVPGAPVYWKMMSGPPGPVDSRLTKAPRSWTKRLCVMKPCAAGRTGSSPPFSRKVTGAGRARSGFWTMVRATSRATPTHAAQSDAPVRNECSIRSKAMVQEHRVVGKGCVRRKLCHQGAELGPESSASCSSHG